MEETVLREGKVYLRTFIPPSPLLYSCLSVSSLVVTVGSVCFKVNCCLFQFALKCCLANRGSSGDDWWAMRQTRSRDRLDSWDDFSLSPELILSFKGQDWVKRERDAEGKRMNKRERESFKGCNTVVTIVMMREGGRREGKVSWQWKHSRFKRQPIGFVYVWEP